MTTWKESLWSDQTGIKILPKFSVEVGWVKDLYANNIHKVLYIWYNVLFLNKVERLQ